VPGNLNKTQYIEWLGAAIRCPPKMDIANSARVMIELWKQALTVKQRGEREVVIEDIDT
jgi:hypothetical protein